MKQKPPWRALSENRISTVESWGYPVFSQTQLGINGIKMRMKQGIMDETIRFDRHQAV